MIDTLKPLTPTEVAEGKALCEKATPEPWTQGENHPEYIFASGDEYSCLVARLSRKGICEDFPAEDNATFVTHTRTAYPRALATIEAQQTLLAEAHRIIDFVQRYWEPEPRVSDNENRDILGLMDAFMANPLVRAVEGGE